MTFWNTTAIIGALLLVLGVFFSCSQGKRFCHGRGGDISSHVLERIDKKVADLNLDEAQEVKYQQLRSRLAERIDDHKSEHGQFVEEIHKAFDREEPDMREITGLVRGKLKKMPDALEGCLGLVEEFYDILDEDQKAKFMKDIKARMEKHHSRKKAA